jgi:serine/threonine protein kinase
MDDATAPGTAAADDSGGSDATLISPRTSAGGAQPSMAELGRSMEGRWLGPYELLEFVGGGGMGAVFRALDSTLDRIVAVKVLARQQSADEEMLKRFRNEAQSAARLDHENIGRVHAVGSDDGWHYIVFEYIEGTNLRDVVARTGPFDLARTIDVTMQLADALQHAAERDVVHRDIKPSNVIITPTGKARIVDMGLARLHHLAGDNDLTSSGMTLGTFDYISPEQARDPRAADVRSDLYSLGCTVYFMLAARPPFADGTMVQKLLQHQQDEPAGIESVRPDVPRRFGEILRRLMRKDPADRYQRPADLMADLLAFADGAGIELSVPRPVVPPSVGRRGWRLVEQLPWLVPLAVLGLVVAALRWGPIAVAERRRVAPPASSASLPAETERITVWRVVESPSSPAERASLAEAVHAARDGDRIELAYDGIRDEPALVIEGKQIMVKAVAGFQPGIRFPDGLPLGGLAGGSDAGPLATRRQAACLIDDGGLRLEGVLMQGVAASRAEGLATSLFALRGAARLECVAARLELLQWFDDDVAEVGVPGSIVENCLVDVTSSVADSSPEPCAVRMVKTAVEGEATFLEIVGPVAVDVLWAEAPLTVGRWFLVASATGGGRSGGPRVRLALDEGQFDCGQGFASLRDSPASVVLPNLRACAEACRFRVPEGRPLLEQAGVGDPEAYQTAIEWVDAGGRYEGSPIFRRIDGAAERVEIDYASAAGRLVHVAGDTDRDGGTE